MFLRYEDKDLCRAAKYGDINGIKESIKNGATDWNNALYYAILGEHEEIVKMMIKRGANNFNRGLMTATHVGNMDIFLLMIDYGARDWNNALVFAIRGNQIDMIYTLLELGADINILKYEHKRFIYEKVYKMI